MASDSNSPPLWLLLTVAVANVVALADLPYGYYQLLRIAVCGVALWVAVASHMRSWTITMAIFSLVAVLYNPLFKIHLEREVHSIVNIFVALLFSAVAIRLMRANL